VCKSNSAADAAEYAAAVTTVPPIIAAVTPDFPEVGINHIGYIKTIGVNIPYRIFGGAAHAPVASVVLFAAWVGIIAAVAAVAALGVIINDLAVYKCRSALGGTVYCATICPSSPSTSAGVMSIISTDAIAAIAAEYYIISYYTVFDNGAGTKSNPNCGTRAHSTFVAVRMVFFPVSRVTGPKVSTAVLNREAV